MFIAALFTITKIWKQPRCLTTDEWIKKMWYLYTMEFCSAMKNNEIFSFPSKWVELENIILRKVSQAQKTKNLMFSLIYGVLIRAKAVMLLDLGQMQRGEHIGRNGDR
jgi:hypothetical protein